MMIVLGPTTRERHVGPSPQVLRGMCVCVCAGRCHGREMCAGWAGLLRQQEMEGE